MSNPANPAGLTFIWNGLATLSQAKMKRAATSSAQPAEAMTLDVIERAITAALRPVPRRNSLERGLWVGYGESGQVVKCSIDSPPFDREQRRRLYLAGQILALGEEGAMEALQKENERLRCELEAMQEAAGWSRDNSPALGGPTALPGDDGRPGQDAQQDTISGGTKGV